MTRQTGFSDVDGSGQAAALVEYLAALATALGDMRREDCESLQLAPGAAVLDVGCAIEIGYPAYGRALFLPERLASAIEAGEITEAQAQRFDAALAARDRAGTFFANAIGYSVVGVKA